MSAEANSEAGARFSIGDNSGEVPRMVDNAAKNGATPKNAKSEGETGFLQGVGEIVFILVLSPFILLFGANVAFTRAKSQVKISVFLVLLGTMGVALCFVTACENSEVAD